jgi:hypothetical protein
MRLGQPMNEVTIGPSALRWRSGGVTTSTSYAKEQTSCSSQTGKQFKMADPEYDALLATEYTTYPHEACVIALGHTIENKADATYRRGELFEKRRRLINDWAEFFWLRR